MDRMPDLKLQQSGQPVLHLGFRVNPEFAMHPADIGQRVPDISLAWRLEADFTLLSGNPGQDFDQPEQIDLSSGGDVTGSLKVALERGDYRP